MSPEKQNLVINLHINKNFSLYCNKCNVTFVYTTSFPSEKCFCSTCLQPLKPLYDYIDDLNHMSDAEKTLDFAKQGKLYHDNLCNVVLGGTNLDSWETVHSIFTATAKQRAEAFLKTINKWIYDDDSKNNIKKRQFNWNI